MNPSMHSFDQIGNLHYLIRFLGLNTQTVFEAVRIFSALVRKYRKVDYCQWDSTSLPALDGLSFADYALRYGC